MCTNFMQRSDSHDNDVAAPLREVVGQGQQQALHRHVLEGCGAQGALGHPQDETHVVGRAGCLSTFLEPGEVEHFQKDRGDGREGVRGPAELVEHGHAAQAQREVAGRGHEARTAQQELRGWVRS